MLLLCRKVLAPPPDYTVSQWADARRQLSSEASAEPGQWRTDRAPYQREMMDVVNDPMVQDVVFMTSAQVGKSEILLNIAGYHIDYDPCPLLMLQPTVEMAEAFSKDRLAPMLRDSPSLAEKISAAMSRDSGNTVLHKQFKGGQLTLAGANAPAALASRPIRIVVADEIDKYPVSAGTEGDPISLAEKRTNNFWNRKRVKVSTPTVKGASRIETAYGESDKRRFFVPCPHCNEMQTLIWGQVKFDEGKPETAAYLCPHCSALWTEGEKVEAVGKGEWRGSAPFKGIAGFHINELYSPWRTLPQIAAEFLAAKEYPERLKTWVNTSLGEVWEAYEGKGLIEADTLSARAEDYKLGTIPDGVALLAGSVDTQGDRLEYYVWGFGEGEEAWVLSFKVFYGDPAHSVVWEKLLEELDRPLVSTSGIEAVPRAVMIDSGGLHTQSVYNFCRRNGIRRTKFGLQEVLAIKGQAQADKPILGKPTDQEVNWKGVKIAKGIKLWPVGVSAAKSLLYGRMKIDAPGPGYVHFSNELLEEFYDQLTAEKQITRYVKGFPTLEWYLKNGQRNEALDCLVYSYAAAIHLDMPRFRERDWAKHRAKFQTVVPVGMPERNVTPTAQEIAAAVDAQRTEQAEAAAMPQNPAARKKPEIYYKPPKKNWVTKW